MIIISKLDNWTTSAGGQQQQHFLKHYRFPNWSLHSSNFFWCQLWGWWSCLIAIIVDLNKFFPIECLLINFTDYCTWKYRRILPICCKFQCTWRKLIRIGSSEEPGKDQAGEQRGPGWAARLRGPGWCSEDQIGSGGGGQAGAAATKLGKDDGEETGEGGGGGGGRRRRWPD